MSERPDSVYDFLNRLNEAVTPVAQRLSRLQLQLERDAQPLVQALQRIAETATPYLEPFVRYHKFINSVSATGWLPYHTVSLDFVEECGNDASLLDGCLADFYKGNWRGHSS